LIALGNVETEDHDRPIEPIPKIISTEVTVNPFNDIVSLISIISFRLLAMMH